jgi:lysozyme
MILARLERRVSLDEGFRSKPYIDSLGYWTIGYGSRWILGEPVTAETSKISESAARTLLRAGLWKAALDAQEIFPRLDELGDVRREVLVNMSYNLGFTGLLGFRRLRARAAELDVEGMAEEMVDSRWFHQVGQRSVRLVEAMRTGRPA